jgi:GNAT superfamily N-acetyltransferase
MNNIRDININSEEEILLVASRMQSTLVEVLGEVKGKSLYSMDWLTERVQWHIDLIPKAKILLLENETGNILGHAIVRDEQVESGNRFAYFSTIYVVPASRGKGLAKDLMNAVEKWCEDQEINIVRYNTAIDHPVIIKLFKNNGYQVTHEENEMVQLTKELS